MTGHYDVDRFTPGLFAAHEILCPETLKHAVPKRQAEFLAGRLIANTALRMLGFGPGKIGRGAFGEPLWPDGIRGSITHSKGFAAVWLTTEAWHPGLDAEHMPSPSAIEAIRSGVLTEAERARPLSNRDHVAVFSAKEALFKALFPLVGKRFGFGAAELESPITDEHLRLRLTRDLANGLDAGAAFDVSLNWADTRVTSRVRGPGL
ncbi:4'-phosphopantetheinyl transferase superfamily protein [Primorskyibacter aestuariivivens]|uniref:4'-phosphopantetheinyl transferase family protein n=1 Tax=Primorskyibacter aestuariivivens TaxID=1888912 RepID=UPI002301FD7A|nr:4'-phosphopantetheinyl transferase superfamily protein [Primorskyibacter aestuariivivens]MDA7430257.1 4'-phosphopantetheinyl transferase superfamily protein [Primorskyibacter aestuariivivens]